MRRTTSTFSGWPRGAAAASGPGAIARGILVALLVAGPCVSFCSTLLVGFDAFASDADVSKAKDLGVLAAQRAKELQFGFAAKLFHEAFHLDPTGWRYLYSAARCEQLDGDLAQAASDYDAFLDGAPADHGLRAKAATQRAAIRRRLALAAAPPPVAQAANEPNPPPPATPKTARVPTVKAPTSAAAPPAPPRNLAPPPPAPRAAAARPAAGIADTTPQPSWRRPLGWTLTAAGGISTIAGLVAWGMAMGDKGDLEDKLGQVDTAGAIRGIDAATAQSERNRIDSNLQFGGGAALIGATVAALGLYAVLGSSDRAAVQPAAWRGGGGLRVAVGF